MVFGASCHETVDKRANYWREIEMKKLRVAIIAVMLMAGLIGGVAAPVSAAAPEVSQGVEVLEWPGPSSPVLSWDAEGTSTFKRTKNGMKIHFKVEGLDPNHVYSAWWIIADVGEDCTPQEFFVLNATGAVSNKHGKATFSGRLGDGPIGAVNGEDILVNEQIGPEADGEVEALRTHAWIEIVDHGDKHELDGTVAQNMFTILGAVGPSLVHDSPSQWVVDNCFP